MPDEQRDPRPDRYDPLHAFPETGPDHEALKLQQQGAPGGPPKAGTCTVQMVVLGVLDTGKTKVYARATQCRRRGAYRTGKYAKVLAEMDAARLDGHICADAR